MAEQAQESVKVLHEGDKDAGYPTWCLRCSPGLQACLVNTGWMSAQPRSFYDTAIRNPGTHSCVFSKHSVLLTIALGLQTAVVLFGMPLLRRKRTG